MPETLSLLLRPLPLGRIHGQTARPRVYGMPDGR